MTVKRYDIETEFHNHGDATCHMEESETGEWVSYEDFERLKAILYGSAKGQGFWEEDVDYMLEEAGLA
jgi:hypothetical protein